MFSWSYTALYCKDTGKGGGVKAHVGPTVADTIML